ncbi:hypothetical protein ACS0TY_023803 [Phlomoides rotata]
MESQPKETQSSKDASDAGNIANEPIGPTDEEEQQHNVNPGDGILSLEQINSSEVIVVTELNKTSVKPPLRPPIKRKTTTVVDIIKKEVPRSRLPALFTTRDRWIPSVDTAGDSSSASSSATLSWWKFAISQRFSSLIHLRSLGLLRPGILRGVSRFYRRRRTRNSVMARQFLFGAYNRSARFSAASPSSSFGLLDSVVQRKAESKKRFSYQGHSPFSAFPHLPIAKEEVSTLIRDISLWWPLGLWNYISFEKCIGLIGAFHG